MASKRRSRRSRASRGGLPRRRYGNSAARTPGWEMQPVDWSWSVAFKKPRSGKLVWILTGTKDENEASGLARGFMAQRRPGSGYVEYGVSKTYIRHWRGYDEAITREEYEDGLRHKAEWQMHPRLSDGAPKEIVKVADA